MFGHSLVVRFRLLPILLTLIALAGCGDAGKSASSDEVKQAPAPATSVKPAPASVGSPDTAEFKRAKPSIQLEEVLYRPKQGAVPFIELANAGADPVSLQQLTLMVDATPIPLERAAQELARGARLLIVFDGPPRADGFTYHAGDKITISADAGRAAILDKFGKPIDEVAWGDAPGAASPVAGGIMFELEPGTSIGRAPGVTDLRSPIPWVGYSLNEVTPGAPNPPPAVRGTHPMSGARIGRDGASLSWFPVPGATSYRVQVAADESFAKLILDQSTSKPGIDVSSLMAGRYVWRVQSQFAGDKSAAYSEASVVTLTAGTAPGPRASVLDMFLPTIAQAQSVATGAGSLCPQSATPLAQEPCWILPVPLLKQHKDTQMLLLEHDVPSGAPHPWDANHRDLDEDDAADNMNCSLASLAMMNHFAGGDLSQDRIGYEIFKSLAPGPEHDLMYGRLVNGATELPIIYQFALGTAYAAQARGDVDALWNSIKRQIERGKPVLAVRPGHAFVIVGYKISSGDRVIVVNDPWEDTRQEFNLGDGFGFAEVLTWWHFLPAGNFVGRDQEASITQDADADGVVDFDETERFQTKPDDNDTDGDGVGDKQDILASVFDAQFGYARFRTGRDEDRDGHPMERDPDSDGGGCRDGQEDQNANGIYERAVLSNPESWNFRFLDDSCQGLAGHLTYQVHLSVTVVPDIQWGGEESWTGINVRLKPVPDQPGYYEDDGSTFQYTGSRHSLTVAPNCRMIGQSWASSSGDFVGSGVGLAKGRITDDGSLAVHFSAGIRSEDISGWADICGYAGVGSGDSHSADFRDECRGEPMLPDYPGYMAGRKTFRFNCHDTDWDATGTVTVP